MKFLGKWLAGKNDDPARAAADAVARAFSLCEAGELAQAEGICQDILRKHPGHPGALHCLGVLALRGDRVADAVALLQQAIEKDNANTQVRYDLAEAYRLDRRWEDACMVYRLLIAARPEVVEVRIGLAECLSSLRKFPEARELCEAVLAAVRDHRRALMLAADLALADQAPQGSEAALRAALLRSEDDESLLLGLAKVLVSVDKVEEAAPMLRRVLVAGRDNAHYALICLVASAVRQNLPSLSPASGASLEAGDAAGTRHDGPLISVIICSIDSAKFASVKQHYAELLAGERHEIIGIHDARSLCEAYNRGARQAAGEIIVFSHDDIEILTPDFAARLKRHLAVHHVVGPCGTSRLVAGHWMTAGWPFLHGLVAHQFREDFEDPKMAGKYRVMVLDTSDEDCTGMMQGLDGMFIAARREVVERCPFDERFDGFHLYDLDFSFSAHLAGFDVGVFRDITMIHYTNATASGYEEAFVRYRDLFEEKYSDELLPRTLDGRRFLPAVFDDKAQVARFCGELLAFRRSVLPG